ncbi:MAG: PQQ-binding-like beta-propeller repeat protein [Acidobacteriota bacterium]
MPTRHFRLSTLAVAIVLSTVEVGVASDGATTIWPGLRGPAYDGTVQDAQLFSTGIGTLAVAWKQELGSGYPLVAVDEQRAVTMFADGSDDVMAAFDLSSGEEIWRYRINETYPGHTGSHDGPISSPALVDDRAYGFGPRGDLFALDASNGQELWAINMVDDLGAEAPFYGFASSPLVVDGVVVVEIGAGAGKTIAGFDIDDGTQIWSVGDDVIAYHSPIVATLGGREQVVAAGQKNVMGIEPETGEVLWSYAHHGDERDMGGNTIVPVPAGDNRLLLLNTHPESLMLRIEAPDPNREGTQYEITQLWSDKSISRTYVVPVYHDGHLYGMVGKIFTCVDAETGETRWRDRTPGDGFPTLVGDQLVIMTKPGILIVANADPEGYDEVARLELFEEASWSAPAFANGSLYLRSMDEIARVDLEAGAPSATPTASWVAATGFGSFLEEVDAADDKDSVVDEYSRLSRTRGSCTLSIGVTPMTWASWET